MTDSTQTPRYPHVTVRLTGTSSNAFSIIALVSKAMRRAGVDSETTNAFTTEATSGDYDNVIRTAMRWVSVA